MDRIAGLIAGASKTTRRNDDDIVDRLSSRYTVAIILTFSALVSLNQWVRNPITCWTPNHFTGAHNKFATQFCWVKNTYYLPWDQEVPRADEDDKRQMVPYYQWISIILLIQAVLFYAPSKIWHGLNSKAGIDADDILAGAHSLSRTDKVDSHEKTLQILAKQMDRFLASRQKQQGCGRGAKCILSTIFCRMCGRRLGSYLLVLFLVSKLFYIANIIAQFFILNSVLAMKYSTFGFDFIRNMAGGSDWTEDTSYVAFPRVTFCDFNIRGQDLGNTQRYTVQCVLPVNMFNEKVYLALWAWMIFVCAASVVSFFIWVIRALHTGDRIRFIKNHLRARGKVGGMSDEELIRKFTLGYLGQDGSFILRLIAHNTNNITTTDIICAVWDLWKEANSKDEKKALYPDAIELLSVETKDRS